MPALDGASMGPLWAAPFVGMLLSIAVSPLLLPKFWHHHYGKVAFVWSAITLAALAARFGVAASWESFVHAALAEYLSFIVLLFALYTTAGGILVTGDLRGRPRTNATILALGTLMASFVGTTGAAMILVRPLIRANLSRAHNAHVVIFFIILVANVGGALTPLGDPPLFVGFLHGIAFAWTAQNLWLQTLIVAGAVLAIFIAVDLWFYRSEKPAAVTSPAQPLRVRGLIHLPLIAIIIAAILMSAWWQPGVAFDVFGTTVQLQNLLRDAVLIIVALTSLKLTPDEHRSANGFSWAPIREVAILFAGIFVTIIPVMAALHSGREGFFSWLLAAVTAPDGTTHEAAYFWLTGLLSAFLDNAPTYLVFFELAGGDAKELMGPLTGTLAAISMGAVYMGALTYIGNAPNLMVAAIAEERGVRMPSFFAYLGITAAILLPLFALLTLLPISPILKLG